MARRSDHTRQQLKEMAINYAVELISKDGIHQFSARAVAKKMGYTVGTLYNIFNDCHDIIMQVNATTLDSLFEFMQEAVNESHTPRQRLGKICLRYWEFAEKHQARWSALFESEIRGRPEQLPTWYVEKVEKLFALVHEQVAQLLPDADDNTLSQMKKVVWGSVHGICQLHLRAQLNHPSGGQFDPIPELIERVLNLSFPGSQ